MDRERDRIDGAGDQVGAAARGLEPGGERVPTGALAVEADRQAALLAQLLGQLARLLRLERARRVVHEHPRGAELGQLARLLDERLDLARVAGAVDEPGVELLARRRDRLARLAQVLDVVQWVVQPEDLDPALGGRGDEAPDEVAADRVRADEEPAAQRHRERRLRPVIERADAFPGALHAAAHRRVEDAAAGDLEVREAGAVEDLRERAEDPRSACSPRAAPARAAGSSCRRASARGEPSAAEPNVDFGAWSRRRAEVAHVEWPISPEALGGAAGPARTASSAGAAGRSLRGPGSSSRESSSSLWLRWWSGFVATRAERRETAPPDQPQRSWLCSSAVPRSVSSPTCGWHTGSRAMPMGTGSRARSTTSSPRLHSCSSRSFSSSPGSAVPRPCSRHRARRNHGARALGLRQQRLVHSSAQPAGPVRLRLPLVILVSSSTPPSTGFRAVDASGTRDVAASRGAGGHQPPPHCERIAEIHTSG